MSTHYVYAYKFRNGYVEDFERSIAERIFNRGAINPDRSLAEVVWADGEADFDIDDTEKIGSVVCTRMSGLTCIERLFEIAQEVGMVVIWHGENPFSAVTNAEIFPHLDDGIREWKPAVVCSARELIDVMAFIWVNPAPWHRIR